MSDTKRILCINTGGPGDGLRARRLTTGMDAEVTFIDVDKSSSRKTSMALVWRALKSELWDLVYQEGSGIAGGLPLIRAAKTRGQRFVISSGDPIGGFFHVTRGHATGTIFDLYERLLYRTCAGFVGWTPYLAGAALAMGAQRAATVEGAVDITAFSPCDVRGKTTAKEHYGLNPGHLVCGIVGSIQWTPRQSYCYGVELLETLKRVKRQDLSILIVGDGSGLERLRKGVPEALQNRIVFTGRLPASEVNSALHAMDIGFVTQTLDRLGNYRLTTKLPEYLASSLPVAMSPIPGFYDYVSEAGWPLPALHPASPAFHHQCAEWLDQVTREEVHAKSLLARPLAEKHFEYEMLIKRFQSFIRPIMEQNGGMS